MNINDIMGGNLTAEEQISALRYKTVRVRPWVELEKEYSPKKHSIATDPEYNRTDNKEKPTVITFGWQKLAAQRMTQLAFGIPVQRVYTTNNDEDQIAANIMESIMKKVRINSINLERGVDLYAACEVMTVWYGVESDNAIYGGEKALYKLRSRTYSPKRGDKLYPLFDDHGDLVALSVEYNTINDKNMTETYFDTLTDTLHVRWKIGQGAPEEVVRENVAINKISGVYGSRETPIWEDGSNLSEEAEWTLSRNGNYIRKNSKPNFVIYTDNNEINLGTNKDGKSSARNVWRLNAKDKAEYVTWQQANDAISFQTQTLKREFFTQIQLPDMSMDEMKTTPMSGESRKMLFIDAQMKVTSESGIWLEFFDREFNVIREHACLMFPQHAEALRRLEVEHIITPYQIRDDAEKISNVANAVQAGVMSKRTGIAYIGYVDDVDKEMQLIDEEAAADVFEPTL